MGLAGGGGGGAELGEAAGAGFQAGHGAPGEEAHTRCLLVVTQPWVQMRPQGPFHKAGNRPRHRGQVQREKQVKL